MCSLWTADFIDADTALEIGLVNHVYADDCLMTEAVKLASRIAAMPPLSIRLIKRTVNQGLDADMTTALDLVSSHIAIARAGPELQERSGREHFCTLTREIHHKLAV